MDSSNLVPFIIAVVATIIRQPNFLAKSLMAEISEKVQPPRNITSLHFDPPGLVSLKLECLAERGIWEENTLTPRSLDISSKAENPFDKTCSKSLQEIGVYAPLNT